MRDECPNCGAPLHAGARVCPECGSDEQTGWSEAAEHDGLGLPEESFDYDEFVQREFESKSPKPRGVHWFWWVIAAVLVVILLAFWFGR